MLGLVLWFAGPAVGATLYVDDSAPGGGDGSSASPFDDLQGAVDAAANGDDLLVAGGTYAAVEVAGKEVHLFGGYDARFTATSPDTESVVEGTPAAPAVTLYESGSSILDGFVVRGGQRGVFIDADFQSTTNRPEVRHNVIEQNGATDLIGGGVYADHCDASFVGNTVRDNVGDRGAGMATFCWTVLIEDNVVEGNVGSGDHGGGLYLTGTSAVVRGNLVRDNEVGVIIGYGWGAGALVYGAGATATFERNVFTGNHAQSVGSGAFIDDGAVVTFDGDLFYANACGTEGGAGIFVDGYYTDVGSHVTLTNVTIADHHCPKTPGNAVFVEAQSTVDIVNSIFWDNAGDDFAADGTSSITAAYTLSEEPMDGVGNLSADPRFADPPSGDFHVRSTQGRFDPMSGSFVVDDQGSPTIDAGDPASAFDAEPAPNGLRVNLGHTGNTAEASLGGPGGTPPTTETTPPGTTPTDGGTGSDPDPSGGSDKGPSGCGCSQGGRPALVWSALLAAGIRRRRGAKIHRVPDAVGCWRCPPEGALSGVPDDLTLCSAASPHVRPVTTAAMSPSGSAPEGG